MPDSEPQLLELETGPNPLFTMIWLHGLGADHRDFEQLPDLLRLPADVPVRFLLPDAPLRPITINGGMVMRGWYDVTGLDINREARPEGLDESADIVRTLLSRELERGMPPERILLGGFSQGGAVALYLGLRYSRALAGVIGLSTYLPVAGLLATEAHQVNRDTPIFLAHGLHDPVLALHLAERSRELLTEQGFDVTWRTYPMPHSLSEAELMDLSDWLDVLIKEKGPG
ncbi:MAG: alpha/beta fold hydrolase [Pseudomonadota bacterium]|nr:alpha/beta fold hydrolase [Pseudomonadota bacterium]